MSVPIIAATEDVHAARWREWQLENGRGQRQGATRARMAFTVLFIAMGLWFGVRFLS